MFDPVQKATDHFMLLQAYPALNTVNIVNHRTMQLQSEINFAKLYTTPRNSKAGAGIMVWQPTARCLSPNVSGPVLGWVFEMDCVEEPTINMVASVGTTLSAERIAQYVLDCLHLFADDGSGCIKTDTKAIEDSKNFPGCVAYRVSLSLEVGKNLATPRVKNLSMAIVAGTVTITGGQAGCKVWYTTNGTTPVPAPINPSSKQYTAPFTVVSGQVVRAMAFLPGYNNSAALYQVAP